MFRFTIRDLLWLTAVVALALSWQTGRYNLQQERFNLRNRLDSYNHGLAMSIDGHGYFQILDVNQDLFRKPDEPPPIVFVKDAYVQFNTFGQLVVQISNAQFLLEPVITVANGEPYHIRTDGQVFVRELVCSKLG